MFILKNNEFYCLIVDKYARMLWCHVVFFPTFSTRCVLPSLYQKLFSLALSELITMKFWILHVYMLQIVYSKNNGTWLNMYLSAAFCLCLTKMSQHLKFVYFIYSRVHHAKFERIVQKGKWCWVDFFIYLKMYSSSSMVLSFQFFFGLTNGLYI